MRPSQIKTSESICDAQQERAALAGGAKAGAANHGPSKVVAAVSPGSATLDELEKQISADYERVAGKATTELDQMIRATTIADAARRVMNGELLTISAKGDWVLLEWNQPNSDSQTPGLITKPTKP